MGNDEFRIDSHKLIYHVARVNQWLNGVDIYPIYIELSLFGGCNHRCIFCAFDFLKYKSEMLEIGCLKKFIISSSMSGVKAILFSGEGEPLLHKDYADIIAFASKNCIDAAVVTNGVKLRGLNRRASLEYLTWMKVSLDAGKKDTHSFIHRTNSNDFGIIIKNIEDTVKDRNKYGYKCVIGVQSLLLPQNYNEIVKIVLIVKNIGVDYLVVKPYSYHPLSINRLDVRYKYANLGHLEKKLLSLSTKDFKIIFRRNAISGINNDRSYSHCLGLPFAAHITARGDIYPCNFFIGNKKFIYGNIYKDDFKDIWDGQRRKRLLESISKEWDVAKCRKSCRLDEINGYLWKLKNPCSHVNFI